jgi:dephospho-CoA kinase
MDYDYIIDNTGSVDDLKEKARQFVEEIRKGGERP